MKISLRYKLLLYMLVTVLFFAGLLIFANTFLVEKYHLDINKKELLKTEKEIEELLKNTGYDDENNLLEINNDILEKMTGLERVKRQSFYIGNRQGAIFYPFRVTSILRMSAVATESISVEEAQGISKSTDTEISSQYDTEFEAAHEVEPVIDIVTKYAGEDADNSEIPTKDAVIIQMAPSYSEYSASVAGESVSLDDATITMPESTFSITDSNFGSVYEVISTEEDGSLFTMSNNSNSKMRTLSYQKTLDNGLVIMVSTPMSVISDGVAISNQFSTIIGLITIIVTIIWSMFTSRRFTDPIKRMNEITKKMAELDFTQKIDFKGSDEIAQLAGNVNIMSDRLDETINELNWKNEKLAQDIDKERKIDKMRRDFISNVSHELKTPIFLIQGYADGLKNNITKEQVKKDFYCDVIIEEADKMNVMVKDLLVLAKMETDSVELDRTDFDLNNLIESIMNKYRLTAKDKDIAMVYNGGKVLWVNADFIKIEQVISNYINNAIEYVDNKKRIEINTEVTADNKVKVKVFNTGGQLAEESQKLIWNSFYKEDEARTRDIGGAGLGLSIVKSIMEAHNNEFGVANEEGGVAFWFEVDGGNCETGGG